MAKVDRWIRRLDRMTTVERNALLTAVTERFPETNASMEQFSRGVRANLASRTQAGS